MQIDENNFPTIHLNKGNYCKTSSDKIEDIINNVTMCLKNNGYSGDELLLKDEDMLFNEEFLSSHLKIDTKPLINEKNILTEITNTCDSESLLEKNSSTVNLEKNYTSILSQYNYNTYL